MYPMGIIGVSLECLGVSLGYLFVTSGVPIDLSMLSAPKEKEDLNLISSLLSISKQISYF